MIAFGGLDGLLRFKETELQIHGGNSGVSGVRDLGDAQNLGGPGEYGGVERVEKVSYTLVSCRL